MTSGFLLIQFAARRRVVLEVETGDDLQVIRVALLRLIDLVSNLSLTY